MQQGQFIQRFGSRVNLHIHLHTVVSDGIFSLIGKRFQFMPAAAPTAQDVVELTESLKLRILRRLVKLGAIPEDSAREMLAREHGGFSLNGSVGIAHDDRAALKRLISYCTRPAISLKRLEYDCEREIVRYRPIKGRPGDPEIIEWAPVDFLAQFSKLIPAPYLNLVRYAGALAPRSALRRHITEATQRKVPYSALLDGWTNPIIEIPKWAKNVSVKVSSAAKRSWALALSRAFEVYPIICVDCGVEMKPMAVITTDAELVKILSHMNQPTEFPRLKPSRAPPLPMEYESQINPAAERWEGIDSL